MYKKSTYENLHSSLLSQTRAALNKLLLSGLIILPGILESATISGTVYDSRNAIYLEGARVTIPGTDRSTTTERGGRYRLTNIEPGSYTLTAASSGLQSQSADIVIEDMYAEVSVNFNFNEENIYELDAFVVEGSLIGAAKGMDIRRSARDYREVVSSDAAGQFTDRNPAEALQRVAGVTVENDQGEGSYLIIRGSSPDLNAVQIDGVSLATPQEDGRTVNLNVITVDQLERIELSKTWLPRQKGNVIGGTVNMVTRSALDRGERFASIEVAGTHREIYDDKTSWRGALTFGDVLDNSTFKWLGDKAIGLQFSINQSEDFSGSDTVSWSWNPKKDYPFRTRPGESERELKGFTLQSAQLRNFNVDRERFGASARLEFRLNDNHELYGSISHNRFDDTKIEHVFDMETQSLAQFYSGSRFLNMAIVNAIGLDPLDPFVKQRLDLGAPNPLAAPTYDEMIAYGEIAYDPELRMFTRGGLWGMSMIRSFSHTLNKDAIDTFQYGGKHRLGWELALDWTAYVSEASQDSEQHWMRFSLDGTDGAGTSGPGGIPLSGPAHQNPYLMDPGENPTLFNKGSFRMSEPGTANVGSGVRQHNLFTSTDKREGYDINLEKKFDWSAATLTTQLGASVEQREKSYIVNRNTYGLAGLGSLDPQRWPNRQITLANEFFDGGEIEGFEDNFGEGLPFGPSFHEENTLAFLKDPVAHGVTFGQNDNHKNANFTSRIRENYDATEDVTGLYLQQTIDWKQWTLILGARFEKTENTFTNLDILTRNDTPGFPLPFIRPGNWRLLAQTPFGEAAFSTLTTREKEYDHLLPAVHLIRRIGENTTVRGSITKTIARPTFSDLIPREILSVDGSNFGTNLRLPAFDLRPMESINYDLSIDYYFQPVGMFSAAVFYKDLDGPIYDEIRRGVGPDEETAPYDAKYTTTPTNNTTFDISRKLNAGKANLAGIELTFDRRFNFLPGVWNGLGMNANIAWFESEAKLQTAGRLGETVPLFKQPSMTGNLSLYYEKHKIFARLSYNIRGHYLEQIEAGTALIGNGEDNLGDLGDIGVPPDGMDIYVDKLSRLDFMMRYRISPSFQIFFEAINLTNEPLIRYRGNESRPVYKQYTERVFTIGVKWTL